MSVGATVLRDPMAIAFWGVACAALALPLASERGADYGAAILPITVGVAWASGIGSAIVVASVAASLWGGMRVLIVLRIRADVAVAWLIAQSILFLTWPIWAARLLLRFDSQPIVDALVRVGPLFAINRAIDPTDAFTHRPGAYRWMNLGQDVPYAMPASIWPCVLLHGAVGLVGIFCRPTTPVHEGARTGTN